MNNGIISPIMILIRAYSRCRQNRDTDKLLEANLSFVSDSAHPRNVKGSSEKYMVIRKKDPKNGLSAYILSCLVSIDYAVRKRMIPVVDMQTYPTPYVTKDETGEVNAWELFFEQPMGIGLDKMNSDHYWLEDSFTSGNYQKLGTKKAEFLDGSDHNLFYWKKIFKRYIRANKQIAARLEERREQLFADKTGIVGVLGRGTDYTSVMPKGHAVQPDADMLISETKTMLEKNNCKYVFLATEDCLIYKSFADAFGDRLIINTIPDIDYDGGWLNESYDKASDKSDIKEKIGTDYLINLMLLSRCDCFAGGITGGTAVVMLMENKFKDIHIFDLGQY